MNKIITFFTLFLTLTIAAATAQAQTTAFTYQGRFTDSTVNQPTNGTYTMTFRLYDAATNGNQIPDGSTSVTAMVSVVNNIFTTRLDFGAAAFNTTGARYLEIQVGQTFLTPRQEITSTPFSQRALNAANADKLGGVAANQFVQTNDSRLTDSRAPTAGSGNYIQNTTTQQSGNFNVSGNGTIGGTLSSTKVSVNGGVSARGGAPGAFGANNNGYAFGTGGDEDGGLFSTANGRVSLYADSTERVRVEGDNTSIIGNLSATGTISGTLANNSVGSAQITDGSLRLADTTIFVSSANAGPFQVGAHTCAGFNFPVAAIPGAAVGDIVNIYPSSATPVGFYIQSTFISNATTFPFYICNTLSTTNTFPAQSIKIVFTR